jgi:hypothetical protein
MLQKHYSKQITLLNLSVAVKQVYRLAGFKPINHQLTMLQLVH